MRFIFLRSRVKSKTFNIATAAAAIAGTPMVGAVLVGIGAVTSVDAAWALAGLKVLMAGDHPAIVRAADIVVAQIVARCVAMTGRAAALIASNAIVAVSMEAAAHAEVARATIKIVVQVACATSRA